MSDELRVLVVQARFYTEIADQLLAGATAVLSEAQGIAFETLEVPGAFEIPAVLAMAQASTNPFDAYVLLGCVIRGETSHYDVVVDGAARGTMDLVVRDGLAVGMGVLTVENRDQAMARAHVDQGNKGAEAARAALALLGVRARLST